MSDRRWGVSAAAGVMLLAGCAGSGMQPVAIQAGTPCAFCRMTVADPRLAAEIVAPGEEPRVYDDIGCLVNDLERQTPPRGSRAFVVDYASGALVPANEAVYTRLPALDTPMASHLVAHRDDAARTADARTRGGLPQTPQQVFGPAGPPGGSHAR
jgi:copper chaperone NosL